MTRRFFRWFLLSVLLYSCGKTQAVIAVCRNAPARFNSEVDVIIKSRLDYFILQIGGKESFEKFYGNPVDSLAREMKIKLISEKF